MNANAELLNYIHQNAQMGQNSIEKILEIMDRDDEFKEHLENQFKEYKEIFDQADKMLNDLGEESKDINKMQKKQAEVMIEVKTMKGRSADHITEMLMKGNLMGIIQLIRRMKEYKGKVDDEVYGLADKLIKTEERNLQEGRKFLK